MTLAPDARSAAARDEEADFAAFRRTFPLLETRTYANVGARGLISTAAHAAGLEVLDGHHRFVLEKAPRQLMAQQAKAGFAKLIGADASEISITHNVSSGVNQVAAGLDWKPGDNVVLGGELEHPNNMFIWLSLARSHGIEVRFAQILPNGEIDLEQLIGSIDERTRVIAVACPTLAPGFRLDLAAVSARARRRCFAAGRWGASDGRVGS